MRKYFKCTSVDSSGRFYCGNLLRSNTDCDILMSVGMRGIGKTLDFKSFLCDRFISKGEQWVYLRRYKSELLNMDQFFSDIYESKDYDFSNYEFKYNSKRLFCKKKSSKKWKLMGFVMTLSVSKDSKGPNFPLVKSILFDEFQIDNVSDPRSNRYLNDEVSILSNMYTSIARDRKVNLYLISNAISVINPYYCKWHILPIPNKITKSSLKGGLKVGLEMCDSKNYDLENRMTTRSSKMQIACGLDETSLYNEYYIDDLTFIGDFKGKKRFCFNVKFNGKCYGVWQPKQLNNTNIYISSSYMKNSKRTYVFKKGDMDENSIFCKSWRGYIDLEALRQKLLTNNVYFKNQNVKYDMFEIFRTLNIIN